MFIHFDEARKAAERIVSEWIVNHQNIAEALLIGDIFGKLRLLLWSDADVDTSEIETQLTTKCGVWWSGDVLAVARADENTRRVYAAAWDEAAQTADSRFRIADRHRSRTGWFTQLPEPMWKVLDGGPPIIVFYSFKGGLGRSTTLASFAIQRARAGERVCVIDFDLDSPGVGLLLNHGDGLTARWGVVDFLLEHSVGNLPLADYFHRSDRVAGTGEISVFPTGTLDDAYVNKLGRIDLEEAPTTTRSGIGALLQTIYAELRPQWVLLDARTGMSESAGYLLSGIAHLHVLLGTAHDQSWAGLDLVIDRLGRQRVVSGRPQCEVLLVHAMLPPGQAGQLSQEYFYARAEREFASRYYVEASDDDAESDTYWDIRDIDTGDAPHVAVEIPYDARLASFRDISEIADDVCAGAYATLAERIMGRFARDDS